MLGIEREVKNGFVVKARYVDRRLGRIIEDIGSQSPEGSSIGSNYNGGIANPCSKTGHRVNDRRGHLHPCPVGQAANPNAGQTSSGVSRKPTTPRR